MAKLIKKQASYADIGQSVAMKYALLADEGDNTWRMQHGWIQCRDFFNDFLIATWKGEDYPRIYSFNPHGKSDPMILDGVRMALTGGNFSAFLESLPLLNEFEARCNIELTTVEKFEESEDYFLTASNAWQANTALLSLYTHVVRALYGYGSSKFKTLEENLTWVAESAEGNEKKYQAIIDKAFDLQVLVTNAVGLQAGCEKPDIANESGSTHIMHDSGGIWSAGMLYLDNVGMNKKNAEIMHGAFLEKYRGLVGD